MGSISLPRAELASALVESIFYGINIILFFTAIFLLALKREKTIATLVLTILTIIIFALATAHFSVVCNYVLSFYPRANVDFSSLNRNGDPRVFGGVAIEIVNTWISDTIVIWRAWGLWNRSLKVITMPVLLWIASLAIGIANIRASSIPDSGTLAANSLRVTTTSLALPFVTNMWVVGLISYRYWIYHKEVVSVLGPQRARYRGILVLFIESGAFYCTSYAVAIAVYASGSPAILITWQILSQMTRQSIYPLQIIIFGANDSASPTAQVHNIHIATSQTTSDADSTNGRNKAHNDDWQEPKTSV
ncbi:hypothetical protein EW026_g6597 [Hermanssonia centrifuga]|uniref:Opsin n=1 Tax=Hermanssonia centrifuga TaxID=98765 RepID=A0A4S4KAN9_9APHY|nr:hypothetical protein EW026_g6597 [Hermanssonia centrifuga]